jgi:hypothetical protein
MPRRRIHLCEVCGHPVYGEETVCPPCLRDLDRILGGAIRSTPKMDEDRRFDGNADRRWWTNAEKAWRASAPQW